MANCKALTGSVVKGLNLIVCLERVQNLSAAVTVAAAQCDFRFDLFFIFSFSFSFPVIFLGLVSF